MRTRIKVASPVARPILRMLHGVAGQDMYMTLIGRRNACRGSARAMLGLVGAVLMTVCVLPAV
jgi:hypothetical protein